ncbi:MAG: sugar ABC transporter substrate-binding protein [Bifidobacteriaceae bacterium]|nr:sugar ABC transporter substrate-binding protein [Bifidobacteriaceae bacterium]
MPTTTRSKPIITLAAATCLATALLAGCTSDTGTNTPSDGGGKTVVTMATWNDNITPEMVDAFEKANTDIDLQVTSYDSDTYSEKVTTMIAGNTAPDILHLYETDAIRLASSSLEPLDSYLSGGTLTSDAFIPAVADLAAKMGGTYGIPWCYADQVLFYNKDLFDAAKVEYPTADWKWEDFRAAAKKLTSGEGNGKQFGADAFSFAGMWYSLAGQAGDGVIDGDGKLVLGDGMKKAVDFINTLTNVDQSMAAPSASGTDVTDLFSAGKAAMTLNGSWGVLTYRETEANWDMVPMPADLVDYTSLHTGFYTISKTSQVKDAAWKFIEFMMGDEGQQLTSIGTSNPSVLKKFADSTEWQHPGGNGSPSNWGAITDPATDGSGQFGYTLASATATNDLANEINAYLLGVKTIEDVDKAIQAANQAS